MANGGLADRAGWCHCVLCAETEFCLWTAVLSMIISSLFVRVQRKSRGPLVKSRDRLNKVDRVTRFSFCVQLILELQHCLLWPYHNNSEGTSKMTKKAYSIFKSSEAEPESNVLFLQCWEVFSFHFNLMQLLHFCRYLSSCQSSVFWSQNSDKNEITCWWYLRWCVLKQFNWYSTFIAYNWDLLEPRI